MQQAITKDVALLALRIAGSLRLDEFRGYANTEDVKIRVNELIDSWLEDDGLKLSQDERYQLFEEVMRVAKKRNVEIMESQWEPDDLDDKIKEAIDDNLTRMNITPATHSRKSSGSDPYEYSDNPTQEEINATLAKEKQTARTTPMSNLLGARPGSLLSQTGRNRFMTPNVGDNTNTPKISNPSSVNTEQLTESQIQAIQEKINRQKARLERGETLNRDQTLSYLSNLHRLHGAEHARKAADDDPNAQLDGDGLTDYANKFGKWNAQSNQNQPAADRPALPQRNNRPSIEELVKMGGSQDAVKAYANRRLTGNNAVANRNQAYKEIQYGIEENARNLTASTQEGIKRNLAEVRIQEAQAARQGNNNQQGTNNQSASNNQQSGANQQNNQAAKPKSNIVAGPKQYSRREVNCDPDVSKQCGGTCIPKDHECHQGIAKIEKVTAQLEAVPGALKKAEELGKAFGMPVTDPKKPMEMVKAAAAFESQARQAMPFLKDDVWKGLSKATNFMIRASVVSSAVLAAWGAFKNAGGAVNPGFKRALDMAEQDALSGIQKMAGVALRPLTDPFEARMAKQESRLRSELSGLARQSIINRAAPGLRSAGLVGDILGANATQGWYAKTQRGFDNEFSNDFDKWLQASARLATQRSKPAVEAIAYRRFAREFTGNVSNADMGREAMLDQADKATRQFAEEVGSRMARMGKNPDTLTLGDFVALMPKRSLERFNLATNSMDSRTNVAFRNGIATSMLNRYNIGRSPAADRRRLLEEQLDGENGFIKKAGEDLTALNDFMRTATSMAPGSAKPEQRKAEGQQRERVIMALARARGYKGDTAGGAYGYLKEKHSKLPKRTDAADRFDKRCGKSGIPDNRKCTKPTQEALPGDLELRTTDLSGEIGTKRRQGLRTKALKSCQAIADAVVRMADRSDVELNALIDRLLPKQHRDNAKRLVGRTKLGLTHFMLDRDNYQVVDIDPENNGVTYKSPDGTLTGLTSAGTKVIAMQTYPWGHSYSLDRPFYETVFTVNNTVDSSKAGAKPNKKEIVEMARNTEALFRKQVGLITEDSAIMVSAFGGDTKEASRTKLYQRMGFTPGLVGGNKSEQGTEMWTMVEAGKLRSINNTEYQKIFGVPRQDHWWRYDKKCGNSGIPDNAKCTKQTSPTQAKQPDSKPKAAAQPTSAVKPSAQQPAAKPTNTPNKPAAPSGPSSRAVATSVAIGAIGLAVGGAALFSHRQIQNPEVRQNFANLMVGAIGEVNKRDTQINEFIDQKLPDNMKEGARNLVGQTKVALNRVGLKAEGTELDSFKVDAEHNLFTYKAKTGEVMSITSVGTKVLAFQSSKSAGLSDHLKFPAYEMAFAVNYEVDSTKSGRTDRKEAIKIARQAQRMFEAQVAEIPDGTLISNVPYVEDGKGDERAKIYQRFGFDYLHESDRKATKGANAGRMWGIKQDGKLRPLTDLEKDRLRDMMVKLDSRSDAKATKPLQMVVNVA